MVAPDEQGDLALGNILDCSFEELYLSGKILKLRRENLNGNLRRYSPCNKCNAWKTVPNIWVVQPLAPLDWDKVVVGEIQPTLACWLANLK